MARKLRRVAMRIDEARAERAELMREASQTGATWREIAVEVGLSHTGAMKAARLHRDHRAEATPERHSPQQSDDATS